jgi:hypothetical protein
MSFSSVEKIGSMKRGSGRQPHAKYQGFFAYLARTRGAGGTNVVACISDAKDTPTEKSLFHSFSFSRKKANG